MVEEFRNLISSINRDGIDNLMNFIEKTDFYTAPASTRYHGNYEGPFDRGSDRCYFFRNMCFLI